MIASVATTDTLVSQRSHHIQRKSRVSLSSAISTRYWNKIVFVIVIVIVIVQPLVVFFVIVIVIVVKLFENNFTPIHDIDATRRCCYRAALQVVICFE